MLKKLLLKIVFVFLLTCSCIASVNAAGITLSPPKFEFEIEPGHAVVGEVKIVNDEDTELSLSTNVQDFIASGETGTPQFIDPEKNDESISLGKWVEVLEPEFTIFDSYDQLSVIKECIKELRIDVSTILTVLTLYSGPSVQPTSS